MLETIKKQRLFFIALIGIVVVSLTMTATFAYQTLQVEEAEGSNTGLTINVGTLDVSFTKTNKINLTNMPLLDDYKTADYVEFTIDNTKSTDDVVYQLNLIDLEYSDFLVSEDFKYTITKVDSDLEYIIGQGNFSDLLENSVTLSFNMGSYRNLSKGDKETLRLYLWLKETDDNQNNLENTSFKGQMNLVSLFSSEVEEGVYKNFKIYGNSVQDTITYGEPSSTNPVAIENLGIKTENLLKNLPTSSYYTITTETDGSVTISGTDTATRNINYIEDTVENIGLKANTNYILHHEHDESGIKSGSVAVRIYNVTTATTIYSSETGTVFKLENTTDTLRIGLNIPANTVLENYNIKLMLEEDVTPTPYVNLGKYRIPITIRDSKNLAHPNGKKFTSNGVTLTTNEDGTVTASGTATTTTTSTVLTWCGLNASNTYYKDFILYPGEKVRASIRNAETGENASFSYTLQWTGALSGKRYYGTPSVNEPLLFERVYTQSAFTAGENIYEGTWIVQVERGSNITDYEPFIEPVTTNIYLDEPLRKVDDTSDYIDVVNSLLVRNVNVLDDTGTLLLNNSYNKLEIPKVEQINIPKLPAYQDAEITVCSLNSVCSSNIEVETNK